MINVSVRGLKLQLVRFGGGARKNIETKMKIHLHSLHISGQGDK